MSCRVVVLISGSGRNLQAIIDDATPPTDIVGVISNNPDAYGLTRAQHANIATAIVDHRNYAERATFDAALAESIDALEPDLIALAGFMRILTDGFVQRYLGRMLNIHPSLLPKYPGRHTHRRALEAGDAEHGSSVHFVTPELDSGPVVLQATVPILPDDNEAQLEARVVEQELHIYPQAVRWFAEGRLRMVDGHACFDGAPIEQPLQYNNI